MLLYTKPGAESGIWIQVQTPSCSVHAHRIKEDDGPHEGGTREAEGVDYIPVQTCSLGTGEH